VGKDAVEEGLIDAVGGVNAALVKIRELIKEQDKAGKPERKRKNSKKAGGDA
jgi:ClpP class serine protease